MEIYIIKRSHLYHEKIAHLKRDICIIWTFRICTLVKSIYIMKHENPVSYFLRFRSGTSTRSLVSFYYSVREQQPGVSYFLSLLTIPFGSNDPESRIFFISYDSVRKQRPGVSYFLALFTIPFGSNNPESRIFYDSIREHQPGVSYLL